MQSEEITIAFESAAQMSDAELLEIAGFATNGPEPTDAELVEVASAKSMGTELASISAVVIVEEGESQGETLARAGLSDGCGVVFGTPQDVSL